MSTAIAVIANPWAWPLDFAVAFISSRLSINAFASLAGVKAMWVTIAADTAALMSNPLFQVCYLVTAFACLYQGVRTLERRKAQALAHETEIRRGTVDDALRPTKILFNFYAERQDVLMQAAALSSLHEEVHRLGTGLDHLKTLTDRSMRDDWDGGFRRSSEAVYGAADRASQAARGRPSGLVQIPAQWATHRINDDARINAPLFSAGRNAQFFATWQQNLDSLSRFATEISDEVQRRQGQLATRELPDFRAGER